MASLDLKPSDIIIGVMGMTGVGKSTFIKQFTDETVDIGDSLMSCTSTTKVFQCTTPEIPKFYLVDTPGFDDSKKTDTDILREVANWLSTAYHHRIKLSGIIYLHRIMDVRVGGAGVKNLRMFRELCGEAGMSSVALVTTFWKGVDEATGGAREAQLKCSDMFWRKIIEKGGKVFRHDQGVTSGKRIIRYLVDRKEKVVYQIQKEMVNQRKTLEETGAGHIVQQELSKLKEEHARQMKDLRKEWKEASDEKDRAWQAKIANVKADLMQEIKDADEQRERLRADDDALRQQIEAEQEEARRKLRREMRKMESRMADSEAQIRKAKRTGRADPDVVRLITIQRTLYLDDRSRRSSCMIM